jgi:hypothetical protein
MKNLSLIFVVLFVFSNRLLPAEGMWLPMLLEKYNIEEMQEKGFRLSAEDIYSINRISMKDAVVRIGGCTGVVVSSSGLVLTNHHCAYGAIQSHSSVDTDYLTDGFWAMTGDEELVNPGLTVTFLVRMEDVTEKILSELRDDMTEAERRDAVVSASGKIEEEAVEGTRFRANVNAFYYGNEFYLFVYDVFDDVRLVGAPPSSIGKFGGDTDNWMWPRHTGDFAFFRIYADHENQPAAWSADNLPYNSPAFLPVSTRDVSEGDFTMVFGFPGSTSQYLTSQGVRLITEFSNPHNIRLRDLRLGIMDREMASSDIVRIQYASKYAGTSNAWKRWRGENLGLARIDAIGRKRANEGRFVSWANETEQRQERYGHVLPALDSLYSELEKYTLPRDYGREALYAIEIIRFASSFIRFIDLWSYGNAGIEMPLSAGVLKGETGKFFQNYHHPLDKQVFVSMMEMYRDNIDPEYYPAFFATVDDEFDSDMSSFAAYIFSESVFTDQVELIRILDLFDEEQATILSEDPLIRMIYDIRAIYNEKVVPAWNNINDQLISYYRLFVEGKRLMEPERKYYPDANRTLRVAYGQVKGYQPADAVVYSHYTTLSGVMEKYRTGISDYEVPARLIEIYNSGDFGQWAANSDLRVAFIASNHTSGGNSGSPVINGDGHLVGVNFDRVWEGTMSDIMFDPERCRNISVAINYILFMTDRFAGAGYLLDEMEIIR